MEFHNILVCTGGSYVDCSMALLGLVILFFIIAAMRKWVFEAMDYPFSFLIGIAASVVTYIITYGLSGSYKIALIVGLILGLVAGYFGSAVLEGGSSE
jgi:hypothetical protein